MNPKEIGILSTILIVSISLLLTWLLPLSEDPDLNWDLDNWETMVIELLVGGLAGTTIAIILYRREKTDRKKLDRILEEQERTKIRRSEYSSKTLTKTTIDLKNDFSQFRKILEENNNDLFYMDQDFEVEMSFTFFKQSINNQLRIISELYIAYSDVVPSEIFDYIQSIKSQLETIDWNLRESVISSKDYDKVEDFIGKIQSLIETKLKEN